MPADQLSGTTAVVTGASRGLGRGVVAALVNAGANVVGIARDTGRLAELRADLGDRFTPVAADAADPVAAGQLIDKYTPTLLVLAAGAMPLSRPLQHQTWQSFSRNWEVDVQQVFHWTRETLLRPLQPGSVVVAFSSGAVVAGSPLSGGYAGAKATIRYITDYAAATSSSSRCFRSSLPRPIWAPRLSQATPPGRARTWPTSWRPAARRSPRPTPAKRSSTWPPTPTAPPVHTCCPPQA